MPRVASLLFPVDSVDSVLSFLTPSRHPCAKTVAWLSIHAWTRTMGPDMSKVLMPRSWSWVIQVSLLQTQFVFMSIQRFSTGVGKTSLLHRYVQNRFDPKNITSTTGAFFVTKKVFIDGLKVRLQLWDTAGQERFRSMVILYISLALPCVSAYSCLFRHLCIIEEQMRPFFCMTLPIFPPLMTFEAG
jgi:hypothetical protein